MTRTTTPPLSIPAFGFSMQCAWGVVFALTIALEVIPIPPIAPTPFYAYCGLKLVLIFALGFLCPLAFWRFNALNHGVFVAIGSAALIEGLQFLIRSGHSFHWYELVAKIGLILFGFFLALDARYEQVIKVGLFKIKLTGAHLPAK